MSNAALRSLPKTDRILATPEIAELTGRHGREATTAAVRVAIDRARTELLSSSGGVPEAEALLQSVVREVRCRLERAAQPTLRAAINATGVVLHTGLGRAVLAESAVRAVEEVARGHSLLEVDPESGERGSRLVHVSGLMRELTGCGDGYDALMVNNNAAAVHLCVSAFAAGREVAISRGQLVEIGGGFRIPDVIRHAGARLVEVGTTNKTRIADYGTAISSETALILRVHPSNFRIVGFTAEPSLPELVTLGRERGVPVLDDLGSGALIDLTQYGVAAEPTVQQSLEAGADLITFSGDKLLGGPQAGWILGRKELIAQLKTHPMLRVLRGDKLTLAAMEATLRLYRDPERARREIPVLAALTAAPETLRARAEALAAELGCALLDASAEWSLEAGESQVGGGSLPGEALPTTVVSIHAAGISTTELARRLRTGEPSVWGRIHRDRLLLDVRTVRDDELPALALALSNAVAAAEGGSSES